MVETVHIGCNGEASESCLISLMPDYNQKFAAFICSRPSRGDAWMDRTVDQTVSRLDFEWTRLWVGLSGSEEKIVNWTPKDTQWNDIEWYCYIYFLRYNYRSLPDYIVLGIVFYVVLYCSLQCYLPLSLKWMALSESTGWLIITMAAFDSMLDPRGFRGLWAFENYLRPLESTEILWDPFEISRNPFESIRNYSKLFEISDPQGKPLSIGPSEFLQFNLIKILSKWFENYFSY